MSYYFPPDENEEAMIKESRREGSEIIEFKRLGAVKSVHLNTLVHVNTTREVEALQDRLSPMFTDMGLPYEFRSFFIREEDGDIVEAWGVCKTLAFNDTFVFLLFDQE